ncbi:MAG: queuosine precursor transporter [Nanoarchaeota archaeon]|nr:queuosine precursor transporter [Nanoarchaeota archaeon]
MKLNKTQATIVLSGMYIFFALTGNIAATKLTFFGRFVMDAGFIYAFTFTWRDMIHKQLGKKAAITTIYMAAAVNLIAALYYQFVIFLPAEPEWALAGGQAAWKFLFGIQMRVVIGSILAQVISELADTQTYTWWTSGFGKGRPQWLRVVVSNTISIPIDSVLFPIIAFAGIVSWGVMWQMFITNILLKFIITGGTWWMIYLVPEKKIYHSEE